MLLMYCCIIVCFILIPIQISSNSVLNKHLIFIFTYVSHLGLKIYVRLNAKKCNSFISFQTVKIIYFGKIVKNFSK